MSMLNTIESSLRWLPASTRETLFLRLWSWTQVKAINFVRPRVLESTAEHVKILIPLNRRTRNHLHSMYFGVLAAGADIAGGLIAMKTIQSKDAKVSLLFKDFQAEFLKRAEGDVVFSCDQGREVSEAVERTLKSGERENVSVRVTATVPSKLGDEPVAKFTLTLSLKAKAKAKAETA